MSQRDFSKNILTLEERNKRDTLIGRLNRLRQQEVINKTRPYDKNRDDILAKQIKDTQLQLGIDPESMATKPSLKNIKKGTDPVNNLGQNASLTTNTPSNRTTTVKKKKVNPKNKVTNGYNKLLKEQALNRLRNPKLGYKQFGGEGAGDDSFEDRYNVAPKKTSNRDRLERSILSSPPKQRNQELAENSRVNRDANLINVDDNKRTNIVEQLASKLLGKNVKLQVDSEFNDDGYMTEEQRYHNLNRGGAITPEQKKRMARIAKEYKAKRAKKVKAQPKVMQTKSNKGASPFSDMKKAMANGNRKRTNR